MATATRTHTITTTDPGASRLELRVELRDGQSVVTRRSGHVPLAARTISGDGGRCHVALVQTAASILGGDRVEIAVEVGSGAALELTTLGATIAYPAGARAQQRFECRVEAGGRFAWLPQPLVLARDCDLDATMELELAEDATAVTREIVVFGRHGEQAGRFASVMRCDSGGEPLLRDSVVIEPGSLDSKVGLGGARAYGTLAALGFRPSGTTPSAVPLAGPGELFRALAPDGAAANATFDPVERAYLAELWADRTP